MLRNFLVIVAAFLACSAVAFKPSRISRVNGRQMSMEAAGPGEIFVPDMPRRSAMNAILLGSIGVSVLGLAVPYLAFFVPQTGGGGGGGLIAKDALGNDVTVAAWKSSHGIGARELVQGLKGDATYLILDDEKNMADYALNAVCTHLGCVVPWNKAENKFMCPCHGSQYNKEGKVVRGPAPLSLALAHRTEDATGKVILSTWTETDFRTGLAPWWK
jgi:cytochrome b6-f complex iron-sulfur subunit